MKDKIQKSLANIREELTNIPQDVLDGFIESLQRHSFSAHLNAHHSVRSSLESGGSCSKTDLLVLSGRDKTNNAGKVTLSIDSLLCGAASEDLLGTGVFVMIREPQFVATPLSSAPAFITVITHSSTQPQSGSTFLRDRDNNPINSNILVDVLVDITTWKPDGVPAADTFFSWICTIEAARSIYFGG